MGLVIGKEKKVMEKIRRESGTKIREKRGKCLEREREREREREEMKMENFFLEEEMEIDIRCQ